MVKLVSHTSGTLARVNQLQAIYDLPSVARVKLEVRVRSDEIVSDKRGSDKIGYCPSPLLDPTLTKERPHAC